MTANKEFYLTLPSNASMDHFPDNTLSHYRNKLPEAVDLTRGDWEVGLAELSAPTEWPNVTDEEVYFYIRTTKQHREKYIVPKGFYHTPAALVEQLNVLVNTASNPVVHGQVVFSYDKIKQRISMFLGPNIIRVNSSLKFEHLTGYRQGTETKKKLGQEDRIEAPHPPDLEVGIYNLFVYTNLVQHRQVGDQRVPLLRIIPVNLNQEGRHHVYSLQNIHYLPAVQGLVDSVEIYIATTFGKPVPYEAGRVIATLHFRQKRS